MQALRAIARFAFFFVILMAAWLLLSGKFDAFHVGWGVLTAIVIAATAMAWPRSSMFPVARVLGFIPWHLWQVFISNLRVARLVLTPGMPIQSRLLCDKPGLDDPRAQTLLGAAITLTPGTLTVDIDGEQMVVHALDEASARDITAGVMQEKVRRVFGEGRA